MGKFHALPQTWLHHQPPTAVPVGGGDWRAGLRAWLEPAGSLERLQSAILERCPGAVHCVLVSSGRAALALLLTALRQLSDRQQVILPAYSCPTVVQSVLAAGLRPVFCDVSPLTLGLEQQALEQLLEQKPLAVLPTHLYGLPQDVRALLALCKAHGVWVIEDAAQAFGARLGGEMVGSLGDAGFYSLGRGKCIPAGHGGVIVAREEIASALADTVNSRLPGAIPRGGGALVAFLAYAALTRPAGWWLVARSTLNPASAGMDRSKLPPVRLSRLGAVQAGLSTSILGRLDEIQAVSRRNAARLMERLAGFGCVRFFQVSPHTEPVFLRLPILVDGEGCASLLCERLNRAGIGASKSYSRTLPGLFPEYCSPGVAFPGAERLAGCLLTLPVHAFMQEGDFMTIEKVFYSIDPS